MYQPKSFRELDRARMHDLIERYPFGTLLVWSGSAELEISHLPFVLDRDVGLNGRLRVHVARANPIWKAALNAGQVMAIFLGPHAYVSPIWYQKPNEQVPTWNYAVVHAQGVPKEMDRGDLQKLLDDLVSINEGNDAGAWRTSFLAPELRDALLGQIVGLAIEITRLDGKFKLSQNRSSLDVSRVVEALRKRGTPMDDELVELMSTRK
jgi:transcriptional regulator